MCESSDAAQSAVATGADKLGPPGGDGEAQAELVVEICGLHVAHPNVYKIQKSFEDRAQEYKKFFFSVSAWLLGIQVAVMMSPFAIGIAEFKSGKLLVHSRPALIVAAVVGGLVGIYAFCLAWKLGTHIKRNHLRADLLRKHPSMAPAVANYGREACIRAMRPKAEELKRESSRSYLRFLLLLFVVATAVAHIGAMIAILRCGGVPTGTG